MTSREMGNAARNVSRASLNRIVSDFRMIEAKRRCHSRYLHFPYRASAVRNRHGVRRQWWVHPPDAFPVDSTTYALASPNFYGYAWRSSITGAYTYVDGATLGPDFSPSAPASRLRPFRTGAPFQSVQWPPIAAGLGTIIFLYERVRYEFKASTAVPGTLGL